MKNKIESEGVIYTVKRVYKGTYSVDEMISQIIQSHYYNREETEETQQAESTTPQEKGQTQSA